MLPRVDVNGPLWRDEGVAGGAEEQEAAVKSELGHLSGFKPILEEDWYLGSSADPSPPESALLQPVDSSPSCSPSSVAFNLDPSQHFLSHKAAISSLLNVVCSNPFDSPADFHLGCDNPVFLGGAQVSDSTVLLNTGVGDGHAGILGFPGLCACAPVGAQDLRLPLPESGGAASFGFAFDGYPFFNRPKVLQPLEVVPPVGAQPTLFQKRAAALRQSSGLGGAAAMASGSYGALMAECSAEQARRGKGGAAEDMGNANIDFSGFNYDSQEATAEDATNTSNANSTVTACGGGGEQKGKKKGMPAKNLMAERRRRKKLNDRLYMLRSVVPKISKMDRASILGDAIEYLKKLLQRINDLHNELESTPCASPLTSSITASFHPLTPTPCTLPWRVKEELCPSPLASPCGQLPTIVLKSLNPQVDVREREGRAVNIHMFCARRPGLLLSTMRALDALGLDIQQAVISCFNGFALDVFRAEQCKDGPGVRAEDIKALLLHTAGCLGAM